MFQVGTWITGAAQSLKHLEQPAAAAAAPAPAKTLAELIADRKVGHHSQLAKQQPPQYSWAKLTRPPLQHADCLAVHAVTRWMVAGSARLLHYHAHSLLSRVHCWFDCAAAHRTNSSRLHLHSSAEQTHIATHHVDLLARQTESGRSCAYTYCHTPLEQLIVQGHAQSSLAVFLCLFVCGVFVVLG